MIESHLKSCIIRKKVLSLHPKINATINYVITVKFDQLGLNYKEK